MSCASTTDHVGPSPAPLTESATISGNVLIAPEVYELTVSAPRIASALAPGQFVHVRVTQTTDVLLRRPLSVHRVTGDELTILYHVVGRGTDMLSRSRVGDQLDLIGPLGRGWRVPGDARSALVVAGGLGAAPMGMLVEALKATGVRTTVVMGALDREGLLATDFFASTCERLEITTDDGSAGRCGLVTVVLDDLITEVLPDVVYTCGPEPMQRAVARIAGEAGIECQVSLERRMACGVGACLSCVVPTRDGLKRACVDGPVFDATEVFWDDTARGETR